MREIKFRAWNKDYKKMFYMESWNRVNVGNIIDFLCELYNGEGGEELILMQFTGLKDKNGKEIYEGDIVKNEFGKIEVVGDMTGTGCSPFIRFPEYRCWYHRECEIIGNIYQNQELVSENKNSATHN
jgi:hypothetical protein